VTERAGPDPMMLEAYKTALETRNFEIKLFWQRSNYFLVLNTAIGTGFFAIRSRDFAFLLGSLGLVASILWLCVNLGSKFWQSRWEQQVEDQEKLLSPAFDRFFAIDADDLRKMVGRSLAEVPRWRLDRRAWYWGVRSRPSVSLMMTYLSCAFVLFWSMALGLLASD
jgi:hypothetical protein